MDQSSDQTTWSYPLEYRILLFKHVIVIPPTKAVIFLPFLILHHSDSSSPEEGWRKPAAAAQTWWFYHPSAKVPRQSQLPRQQSTVRDEIANAISYTNLWLLGAGRGGNVSRSLYVVVCAVRIWILGREQCIYLDGFLIPAWPLMSSSFNFLDYKLGTTQSPSIY